MRIAILGSRGYPSSYGGFETFVRRLAPYLTDQGHDVTVFCRRPGVSLRWHTSFENGVRQVFTPGWDHKSLSTLSFGAAASFYLAIKKMDAVLVLNVANGFFLPLIKLRRPRIAVNVDGIEWERGKWSALGKWVFRRGAMSSARFADEIICDSRAIQGIWSSKLKRRGVFIPYGADVHLDRPTDRLAVLGLESGSYGLVVARLTPENNVDLILDAFELLSDEVPLVVVGSANYDSPTVERLQRLSRERRSFRWLGHIDDQELLSDLWFHSAVYVHGHSVGGTNPALLQALGCGAPTLALDTPYNREVVEHEEMLFPPNPPALALRIRRQLDGGSITSATCRSIIADRYRWETSCASYAELLASALAPSYDPPRPSRRR